MVLSQTTRSAALAFALVLCSPLLASAAGIQWVDDPRQAAKMAAQRQVPILIHVTASWCHYCHKMARETYTQPDIIQYANQNFVCLKLDADKEKDIVKALNIRSLPTTVVITPEMQVVSTNPGYSNTAKLSKQLTESSQKFLAWNNRNAPAVTKQHSAVAKMRDVKQSAKQLAANTPRPAQVQTPATIASTTAAKTPVVPTVQTKLANAPTTVPSPAARPTPTAPTPVTPAPQTQTKIAATRPSPPAAGQADAAYARIKQPVQQPAVRQVSRTEESFAFDQLCVVTLLDKRQKQTGNPRFMSYYRGQQICFAGAAQKSMFDRDPERYWPVMDGRCAVSRAADFNERPGKADFGAVFRGRMWFFSSRDYMRKFIQNPQSYLAATRGPGV